MNKKENNPEQKMDQVLGHEYDGIQEFDNPLPNWWLLTFYGAIVYSVLYVGYYHFGGPGKSTEAELAHDLSQIKAQQLAAKKADPGPSEESLLAVLQDPERKKSGQKIFTEKCASCHAGDGGGLIGPNLADAFWIHGKGTLVDLLHVIADGVPDKGMPPWKALLKKDEVQSVVAYVKSLQGTRPAAPKAAQGEEVKKQ